MDEEDGKGKREEIALRATVKNDIITAPICLR